MTLIYVNLENKSVYCNDKRAFFVFSLKPTVLLRQGTTKNEFQGNEHHLHFEKQNKWKYVSLNIIKSHSEQKRTNVCTYTFDAIDGNLN